MSDYLPKIESHLKNIIAAADFYSREDHVNRMWPSAVETRTGLPPEGEHIPKRVYRLIGAPRGSTLYWDMPLVVAAHNAVDFGGSKALAEAADAYIREFLDECVADNGMFLWGNHQYYDLEERQVVSFHKGYHELRPFAPAWNLLWRHAPAKTAAYICAMGVRHVYDEETGGFNRHDTQSKGHAFIEAGGVLAESLAWLFGKTGEEEQIKRALKIARYSLRRRNPSTGLLINEPDMGRWDSKVSTTEVGVWAQSMLRAADYSGCQEFADMAREVVAAWISYGFEEETGRCFGQLDVESGEPVEPTEKGYWPGKYADPWTVEQWPTHDYPMALGEACVALFARTGESEFKEAALKLGRMAMETRPNRTDLWAYAENYGRCVHLLARCGLELGEERMSSDSYALADEAVDSLYENGMFQGFDGGHIHEAVDGVGWLFIALMALASGQEPELFGMGF